MRRASREEAAQSRAAFASRCVAEASKVMDSGGAWHTGVFESNLGFLVAGRCRGQVWLNLGASEMDIEWLCGRLGVSSDDFWASRW